MFKGPLGGQSQRLSCVHTALSQHEIPVCPLCALTGAVFAMGARLVAEGVGGVSGCHSPEAVSRTGKWPEFGGLEGLLRDKGGGGAV